MNQQHPQPPTSPSDPILTACLTLLSPHTPPPSRTLANQYLTQWKNSPQSWGDYARFVQSHLFFSSDSPEDVSLLLLTMYHSKIKREWNGLGGGERMGLKDVILGVLAMDMTCRKTLSTLVMGRLCSIIACVLVRCCHDGGGLNELVIWMKRSWGGGDDNMVMMRLKLLSLVPDEVEGMEISSKEREGLVTKDGDVVKGEVLRVVWEGVVSGFDERVGLSLTVLRNWAELFCITISQLHKTNYHPGPGQQSTINNPPNSNNGSSLLSLLLHILSLSQPEAVISKAAKALTASLLQQSYSEQHHGALSLLLSSISSHGCLLHPFNQFSSHETNDGALAIITLATTIANENMDDLLSPHSNLPGTHELIHLLYTAQQHHHIPIAITVLDTWLVFQDIPTVERREEFRQPLFRNVLDAIATRAAYPPHFVNWEEEVSVEGEDFGEFRRLAKDVLVSVYYLLKEEYLAHLVQRMDKGDVTWNDCESVLFCLCAVSRESSKITKSSSFRKNGQQQSSISCLLTLTESCLDPNSPLGVTVRKHILSLSSVAMFVGSYASVWNVSCGYGGLCQLLTFLRECCEALLASKSSDDDGGRMMAVTEVGKSVKLICVGCATTIVNKAEEDKLSGASSVGVFMNELARIMEVVMANGSGDNSADETDKENVDKPALFIAEGCARLCTQLKQMDAVKNTLLMLATPILKRIPAALAIITEAQNNGNSTARLESACRDVARGLKVTRQLLRFCDGLPTPAVTELLSTAIWPIMTHVASSATCRTHDGVLEELLGLHGELINTFATLVKPNMSPLMTFVVQAYEETHLACTLDTIGLAVESFADADADSEDEVVQSFNYLLQHLAKHTLNYVTTNTRPHDCPALIQGFFDMTKRYLLFCPGAILQNNPEFPTIVTLAVACLDECQGERDSTRAVLNFFTTLFSLGMTQQQQQQQQNYYNAVISSCIIQNGQVLSQSCLAGLVGSMPQMLWPPLSECLYALLVRLVTLDFGNANNNIGTMKQGEVLLQDWLSRGLQHATMTVTSSSSSSTDDVGGGGLSNELRTTILSLLFGLIVQDNGSKSKKQMIKMLLQDFAKICKGEMSVDSLVSYSLNS